MIKKQSKKPKGYRPKKRYIIEPFREEWQTDAIENYLFNHRLRDWAIWIVGLNTGLRMSDILRLQRAPVLECLRDPTKPLQIYEKKTGKAHTFLLNAPERQAIQLYLNSEEYKRIPRLPGDLIFTKSNGHPVSVASFSILVQSWADRCQIRGNFGSHSLRKTHAVTLFNKGVRLEVISHSLNHRTIRYTMSYLCIRNVEIDAARKEFPVISTALLERRIAQAGR